MTPETITDALIYLTGAPLLYAALRAHHHITQKENTK